ncbi:MAG TPA: aminotransferase class I/II-fold pyridoxal phosphate-dependent enzyme [Gaiellaceae bacterium]|jgi:methionine-gamma-lyase|nr:aminotransferase class I/II-fold pyridoxal phosphate-dependent enzyme [Gaiellaceae bacterium]
MRKRGLSTRAVHGRSAPDAPGHPLVHPIVNATTFSFESAAEFGRVMTEEEYGFLYSRLRNPTVEELNRVLAELEEAEAAQAFASGMAAIAAALLTNLSPGDTVLCAKQLYGNTYSLLETRLKPLGIEVVYEDVTDVAAWKRPAHVRYVETMANPGVPVADLTALAETKGDGVLIVDNTFASPALCRPLEHGADIVCESATKYLNGHHDVTAGVVAGNAEAVERMREHLIDTGATLDPFPAFLLRRGLKTLTLRVERAGENALALARFLEGHASVARVFYAGLETYPQHEVAARQLDGFGGMLAFEVQGGRPAGEAVMDRLELCYRATSLGGVDTVVSHPASTSHRQYSEEQLATAGISSGLLRVSVGCEDADDILGDFGQALDRL